MSALSQESIKHLTKSELKTELTKQGLPLNGRKDDLLKRLTETLNEESNKVDDISIEMIKELFTEMFKAQEETITKILSSCNSDTIVRLGQLSEEIQDNNEKLEKLNKQTQDLKISLETFQEIFEKKFQKVDDNLCKRKKNIRKTLTNDHLCERVRDRSRRDNLRIDGIGLRIED